jgi:hypothetical protein
MTQAIMTTALFFELYFVGFFVNFFANRPGFFNSVSILVISGTVGLGRFRADRGVGDGVAPRPVHRASVD